VWPKLMDENKWQYTESTVKEGWENKQGLKGLFNEPQFLELYTYALVSSRTGNKYALVAWFKKGFLEQLDTNPLFRVIKYQYTPWSLLSKFHANVSCENTAIVNVIG